MTEKEAELFIEETAKLGSVMGLDTMRELLKRIGNPEKDLKTVHIAGTNGKGSVLAYVSAILKAAGYKTGRYFSPSLGKEFEKIQINGKAITSKTVSEGLEIIKQASEEMKEDGLPVPTLFEVETALAFWYFSREKCDIAVIECGLGGETDATNVIPAPLVCVFAHIDEDHKAILGNTIEEITRVKSGIIKARCDVVSVGQNESALKVLRDKAQQSGASLLVAQPSRVRYGLKKQRFDTGSYKDLEIGIAGTVQPENAAAAVCTADILNKKGFDISEKALRKGLAEARWNGRFTILRERPYLIADGAHNPDAAGRLSEALDIYFKDKKVILILGILKDKEYDKIVKFLVPHAKRVVTLTPPENPRALPALELAKEVGKYTQDVTAADSVEEALEVALLLSKADGSLPVVAAGSLSWLARLEKEVLRTGKQKK
ncbi:MAG: bifunctional folylpolyglutamate synthase/dihydrofolate synthase [Lachnospiraceae bacterium]|nr:bifunctional folylpolyglutamate synthase/dihydrofolate synthase [Lachnospiraceae bacterium]